MNTRSLSLRLVLAVVSFGAWSHCMAQDLQAATSTVEDLAKRYPKGRDYSKQWHEHVMSRGAAPTPLTDDTNDDKWQAMTFVTAQCVGILDFGIERSRVLRPWSQELHPGENDLDVRHDLCEALMGRHEVAPVLEESRSFLSRLNETALPKMLAGLRDSRPVLVPMPTTRPMIFVLRGWMGGCRAAARLNELRALVALRDGDSDGFVAAFRDSMAVAEVAEHDASAIPTIAASAIRTLAYSVVQHAVVRGNLTPEMRTEIQELLDSPDGTDWAHFMNGERLIQLDAIDFAFEDENWLEEQMVKTESDRDKLKTLREGMAPREETLARLDHLFDLLLRAGSDDPAVARPGGDEAYADIARIEDKSGDGRRFALISILGVSYKRLLQRELGARTASEGLRALLAIESYRAEHGSPPDSLAELVPAHLPAVPKDWYTLGVKELRYKRLDPAADKLGRPYLLYSTGVDGVDDGGTEDAEDTTRGAFADRGRGFDVIINTTRQWPRPKPKF